MEIPTQISTTFESVEEVIRAYGPIMHAMAAAGGPTCEVVLHNLDGNEVDLSHTIVAIINGRVTGRQVGGPSTSIGVQVQKRPDDNHDALGYRGLTHDGRELRCSSVYFRNAAGRIVAALCINIDLSAIQHASILLEGLLTKDTGRPAAEYIGEDLVSTMEAMIAEAIHSVGKPISLMNREEKIRVLRDLDSQGVTQMRKSVESIAIRLGISRVTAYAYLDEAKRGET